MTQNIAILPGITMRCRPDGRFKQGCLSVQLVRPMNKDEAALNALLPAVLLRGTEQHPDLRAITWRLDELYGASVGELVRRVGDYQTTGLYCGFIEDRYALAGDKILEPMIAFLEELLLRPVLENGVFRGDFVESEKKNLIATIEAERNDKRVYANSRMIREMCRADSFGIPRLGEKEQVAAITPQTLHAHYRRILRQSRVDLFYVGSAQPAAVAGALKKVFSKVERSYVNFPEQTPFHDAGGGEITETLDVAQGKLCMGFTTPTTIRDGDFVPMQLMNMVFGGGMTSKLFMNVREKMSLCYDIGSGYHGAKGILTVSAGIDFAMEQTVRQEIMGQLAACQRGDISHEELTAAKEALLSRLRGTHDSPGAIEGYYSSAALSGLPLDPAQYMEAVEKATLADVVRAANSVKLHTVYFLKGVGA